MVALESMNRPVPVPTEAKIIPFPNQQVMGEVSSLNTSPQDIESQNPILDINSFLHQDTFEDQGQTEMPSIFDIDSSGNVSLGVSNTLDANTQALEISVPIFAEDENGNVRLNQEFVSKGSEITEAYYQQAGAAYQEQIKQDRVETKRSSVLEMATTIAKFYGFRNGEINIEAIVSEVLQSNPTADEGTILAAVEARISQIAKSQRKSA